MANVVQLFVDRCNKFDNDRSKLFQARSARNLFSEKAVLLFDDYNLGVPSHYDIQISEETLPIDRFRSQQKIVSMCVHDLWELMEKKYLKLPSHFVFLIEVLGIYSDNDVWDSAYSHIRLSSKIVWYFRVFSE